MAAQKGSDFGPNNGNWASTLGQRPSKFKPTLGQRPSEVISSACTANFSLEIFTRREKLKAVINFNGSCIWFFYNEIGAVAQCPNNWGVGSAFHSMKIHIYFRKNDCPAVSEDGTLCRV